MHRTMRYRKNSHININIESLGGKKNLFYGITLQKVWLHGCTVTELANYGTSEIFLIPL